MEVSKTAENVIRQDVVQISFDVDNGGLNRITSEVGQLRSAVDGVAASDGLSRIAEQANGTGDALNDAARQAQGLGEQASDTGDALGGASQQAQGLGGVINRVSQYFSRLRDQSQQTHTSLNGLGNLTLKQLNKALKTISDKLTTIAKKAAGAAYSGLKKLAGITFKSLAIGAGVATAAVGALVTQAVSAYGDFEQLKGGVETLFGAQSTNSVEEYAKLVGKSVSEVQSKYNDLKASEDMVFKNANDAFKTAGLSANEYMETVTGFSASLIQSLNGDTVKAAKLSDQAIIDMSDNANKMGTDMGMIQNAYQGFAKQNYMMLDNLKLGYGGTKTEMERLLADAGKLAGQKFDISSYADIIEAIHVIQENMGITDTTAKEASTTIQGSLSSMKAAWGNMLPALVKGGDSFDQCVENLVSSVKTFAKNIMPAIKSALKGVSSLITELTPIVVEAIPTIANDVIPALLTSAASIMRGLISALPSILNSGAKVLADLIPITLPTIASGIARTIVGIGSVIVENAPILAEATKKALFAAVQAVYQIFTGQAMGSDMFNNLKTTVETVITSIQKIVIGLVRMGQIIWNNLAPILSTIGTIAFAIFNGIANNINTILPIIHTLVIAFIVFKTIIMVVSAIMAVYNTVTGIMAAYTALSTGATVADTAAQYGNNTAIIAGIALKIKEAAAWVAAKAALIATTVATKAAAIGQMLLNGTLLACPITWIVIAILALVAVFVILYNKCEVVRDAFNKIGEAIKAVGDFIGGFFSWCKEKLGFESKEAGTNAGEQLKEGFSEGSAGIDTNALNLGTSLDSSLASGIDMSAYLPTTAATNTANQTTQAFSGIDTSIFGMQADANLANGIDMSAYLPTTAATNTASLTNQAFSGITDTSLYGTQANAYLAKGIDMSAYLPTSAVEGIAASTKNALSSVPADTALIGSQAATNFSSGLTSGSMDISSIMGGMQGDVSTAMTGISTDISSGSQEAADKMNDSMSKMSNDVKTKMTEITDTVKTSMESIKNTVNSVDLSSSGANMISGLINGMESRRGALIATAQSMANAVKSTLSAAMKINSPSKVTTEMGMFVTQGLEVGMTDELTGLKRTAKTVGATATESVQNGTGINLAYNNATPATAPATYRNSTTTEYNTYSPSFNCEINGAGIGDRELERKFKAWFKEAIDDYVDGANRRNPRLTEA